MNKENQKKNKKEKIPLTQRKLFFYYIYHFLKQSLLFFDFTKFLIIINTWYIKSYIKVIDDLKQYING